MASIIQIEEFTLSAGLTDIVYSTSGPLPNALIAIYCDKYGVYPSDVRKENNSIHIVYEPQTETIHVALLFLKGDLSVINNLTSDSETNALSAAQGKALKTLIDNIGIPALADLTDVDVESLTDGDILQYDANSSSWINVSMPSIPSEISDLTDVVITNPANGQTLVYNNGEWINDTNAGGSVIYSTSEQVIGKWLDNSTLYKKTYEVPYSSLTTDGVLKVFTIPEQNISIKNIYGFALSSTYGYCQFGGRNYSNNQQSGAYFEFINYYSSPALKSSVSLNDLNNKAPNITITIEYTKTS